MSLARPEPDLEHVKEAIDEDWAPHDDLSDEDEEQTREGDEDNDEDENEEDVEEEKGVCSGVEPGGQSKSDMTAPSRQPTDNRARPGIHLNQPYSDVQHRITSPKTAERLKSPRPLSAPDNFFQSRPRGAKFGRARSTRDPISREVTNEDENKQADDDSELTLAVSSDSGDDKTLSPRSRIDSGTVTPRLLGGEQNSDRSESSSESASTVTQGSTGRHEKMRKTGILAPKEVEPKTLGKPRRKPNALSFLDQDSPPLTEERIRQTVAAATEGWSPRSISSASSVGTSSLRSLVDTDATTPEQSINGDMSTAIRRTTFSPLKPSSTDSRSGTPTRAEPNRQQRILSKANVDAQNDRYGTPEMARGSAKHPLIPPSELQPRLLTPGHGHAKHLPRAEKLPLTGYELLAAKLSGSGPRPRRRSGSSDGTSPSEKDEATIKPIYRRFEALNHRLLLYLQDELNELEEQLHRLDTADTQTRRLQNCILPASRRAEFMAGGELQWHKQDILSKIGFKLEQYNHVLTSFNQTQELPPARMSDIEDYRTYLATSNPIAEIETRFLEPTEDLVCLVPDRSADSSYLDSSSPTSSYHALSDDALTPMPHKMSFGYERRRSSGVGSLLLHAPSTPPISPRRSRNLKPSQGVPGDGLYDDEQPQRQQQQRLQLRPAAAAVVDILPLSQVAILAAVAVIVPIVTFPLITDFLGRMAVVLVVGIAISALRRRLADAGFWVGSGQALDHADALVVVGVYGVAMGVVAAVF